MQLASTLGCHDCKALATVAVPCDSQAIDIQTLMHRPITARFGNQVLRSTPNQSLSDNGSI